VCAVLSEVRDQHPRIPAARGHVIDHRHSWPNLKEGQRLGRMAVHVSSPILVAARVREHFGECWVVGLLLRRTWRACGKSQGRAREGGGEERDTHRSSPIDLVRGNYPPRAG